MDASQIDTIRQILSNYGVDDMLTVGEFEDLASELETRENYMVTDIGSRFMFKDGLDRIIREV